MQNAILEKFLDYIMINFQVERDEIDIEKSLVDEGIIDSFGLIEIAAYIHDEFSVDVNEEDMIRANFASVKRIVHFIQRKMKSEEPYNKMQKVCSI